MTRGDGLGKARFEIRAGRRPLVLTDQLREAQLAAQAIASAGEAAEIVDRDTGQLIERYPPQKSRPD
jgi:hypothetical protein